jgi:bifunctional enzyme CysN/CysC
MATGASTADLAVILIDARHGVMTQTKRHSFIVSLLGIRHVVVTINKMDLVGFQQEVFDRICTSYQEFSQRLDLPDVHFLPISALNGDNVVDPSPNMPWYNGATLMHLLESVYIGSDRNLQDFRFPVQWVNRPNLDFRGFCGTIASGIVRQGDEVMILPSRRKTHVKEIVTFDGPREEAFTPQSVTLTLTDEVDASRGDMIVRPGNVPRVTDTIEAVLVWMSAEPMVPGKTYLIKHTSQVVPGEIESLRYKIDVNTLHRSPAPQLELNEIARCRITVSRPLLYDAYRNNRSTGALIVIDRISNATLAAGMILEQSSDRNASRAAWEDGGTETESGSGSAKRVDLVTAEERNRRFGQKPVTLLFTGLSGSGKTSLAYALERSLFDAGRAVAVLDGEQMRRGISKGLGYSAEDRSENLRRSAHLAKLINDTGMICLAAFVAPNQAVREKFGHLVGEDRFAVIHVSTPEAVCRQRDSKSQWKDADQGVLRDFPGVTAPYETPDHPALSIDLGSLALTDAVSQVEEYLRSRGFIR